MNVLKTYRNKTYFGHYLAGLWEGDGNLTFKNKAYPKPTLQITFHRKELPLAEKLLEVLSSWCGKQCGSIFHHKSRQAVYLNISSTDGLILFVRLTHHKLRGPKVVLLNMVIDYLNLKAKACFSKAQKSKSPISNAWLTGFIDADGSFALRQRRKTETQKGLTECAFILVQRRYDPKLGLSYDLVFQKLARLFNVKVHTVNPRLGRQQLRLKCTNAVSKAKLRQILSSYPHLTSKCLDFYDWCRDDDLIRRKNIFCHVVPRKYATLNKVSILKERFLIGLIWKPTFKP